MRHLPLAHFDETLWFLSRNVHKTLFVIGTLLMVPGVAISYLAAFVLTHNHGNPGPTAAILATFAATSLGGFAWVALGLLFFKRADLRWQRVCWSICSAFGWVTIPSLIGVMVYLMKDAGPLGDEGALILLLAVIIFGTALAAAVHGTQYARLASKMIRTANPGDLVTPP